jgi:hypothetical protein
MWLIKLSLRRFKEGDRVRFYTEPRKGTGKGIVLTPNFKKGYIIGFNTETQTYIVKDLLDEVYYVHSRNLTLDK